MAELKEYVAKNDRITPSSEGATAWTNAGRRIAPAYNEAAHFLEKSGVAAEQLAHNAEQTAKLQDALNQQYKLLSDIYHEPRPEDRARASSSGRGGGIGALGDRGGGGGLGRAGAEISHAASDLTSYAAMNPEQHEPAKGYNKGGKEIDIAGGQTSEDAPGFWTNTPGTGWIGPARQQFINGDQDFTGGPDQWSLTGPTSYGPIGPNAPTITMPDGSVVKNPNAGSQNAAPPGFDDPAGQTWTPPTDTTPGSWSGPPTASTSSGVGAVGAFLGGIANFFSTANAAPPGGAQPPGTGDQVPSTPGGF